MTDERKIIDIVTRNPIERFEIEQNINILQYLNVWKKYCKDTNVKSIFILTITDKHHINYDLRADSEYHLLLANATIDDLKREIIDEIFPHEEPEEEE